MKLNRIILITLVSLSLVANGTTLPAIHIDRLFDEADYVLIAQVIDGRTLESSGHECGAKYTGKVIRKLKGENDKISFGHFHGLEIGSTYLLFLTRPGREFAPIASTNSMTITREKEFREKCGAILTLPGIMHSGYGAIEITWARPYDYEDAAKVPSAYVVLPDSISTKRYNPSEKEDFDGYVWVLESDLVEYLEQLP